MPLTRQGVSLMEGKKIERRRQKKEYYRLLSTVSM